MAFTFSIQNTTRPKNIQGNRPRSIVAENLARGTAAGLGVMLSAVRQATPVSLGLTRLAWQASPVRIAGSRVIGQVFISGGEGLTALTHEKGAKPHFPPVPQALEAEPALGTWLRRARGFEPFVIEDGVKRRMDPSSIQDVRAAAFKISQKIRARGFPRRGVKTRIYSRAIARVQNRVTEIETRTKDNIAEALGRQ